MHKLMKGLKALAVILKKPYLLNKIIDSEEVWEQYAEKKYSFTGFSVVKFEDIFEKQTDSIYPYSFTGGGSLITDLLLLKTAAMHFPNCSYFEIGTWRGESVANIASIAKECYTLNLSSSELKSLNLDNDYISQIGLFSKQFKNVTHLEGNSLHYDFSKLNKKFDLIFIDGNHHYEYVFNDTKKVFESLIHENSIVVWHDYAYNPEKIRSEVASAILDAVPEHLHQFLYHPEGTMSALYIHRVIKGKTFKNHMIPDNLYYITVKKDYSDNQF